LVGSDKKALAVMDVTNKRRERGKKGETAQMKSRIGGFQADRAIAHTHTQSLASPPPVNKKIKETKNTQG
jgi:hypothetical protein